MTEGLRVAAFLVAIFIPAGVMTAFLPLWLADRGLSAADIGQVLGLATVTRLITMPAWGWFADRKGRRTALAWAGSIATGAALAFLPANGFLSLLAVAIIQGGSSSALMPLADAVSLALSRERKLDYGQVRAVGSAAFMAATAMAGWMIGLWGIWIVPLLIALPYAVGVGLVAALPAAAAAAPSGGRGSTSVRLLTYRPFLLTLAASAIIQGTHAGYYGLASLHWRAHGLSELTIGLLWAEGVMAETLLFFFGRRVTSRMSAAMLTATAAGCCVLRWCVTAMTTEVAALAAVQMLHGATYGMQHLSAMILLSRTIPATQAGTAQTLHGALGAAVPVGILMWVVGMAYDGSGAVFFALAALGAAGLPVAYALRRFSLQAI